MKRVIVIAVLGLNSGVIGCKSNTVAASAVQSDLGPAGNQHVVDSFNAYTDPSSTSQHCNTAGTGQRVILTGFGLFQGANFNPSGMVVSSFADPTFQAATVTTTDTVVNGGDGVSSSADGQGPSIDTDGTVAPNSNGGIAQNREITINGQTYEICFLTLDVLWDLAGAIVVSEAHQFQPSMIMMSGRNSDDGAIWEKGAINNTDQLTGYVSTGASAPSNLPVANGEAVIPSLGGAGVTLTMNWNNASLDSATAPLITGINPAYAPQAPLTWRDGNNYVCNNISLITLAAHDGTELSLAGGLLTLDPTQTSMPASTKIGFFHYPVSATNGPNEVHSWINVVSQAIATTLPATPAAAAVSAATAAATTTGS